MALTKPCSATTASAGRIWVSPMGKKAWGSAPHPAKGGPHLEPVHWGDRRRGYNTDVATASLAPSPPIPPWMGIQRGAPLCGSRAEPWPSLTTGDTPMKLTRRAALAGAAALPSVRARAQAPAEVKIAMLVPLSGPWARQGILEQMGARL